MFSLSSRGLEDGIPIHDPSSLNHHADSPGVANVLERIGIEQNEIRSPAHRHRADFRIGAKHPCGLVGRRGDRRERRQPGRDLVFKLEMDHTWKVLSIAARRDAHASGV